MTLRYNKNESDQAAAVPYSHPVEICLSRVVSLVALICVFAGAGCGERCRPGSRVAAGPAVTTQPSLQVDYPHPTADKPQSKIWFAHGSWWALLPTSDGPSVWQRTANGWREHIAIRRELQGLPGRADVWSDADGVTAVAVAPGALTVFRLHAMASPGPTWKSERLASWSVAATEPSETATIARDGTGTWWVAAPIGVAAANSATATRGARDVLVWHSLDGVAWKQLHPLASGLSADDICVITPVRNGVGVAWSDQNRDQVMFRRHVDGRPAAVWEPVETIAAGGRTADDHLRTALAPDGTLWLATKNSLDTAEQPQLVLRVRSPRGAWQNLSYAPRTRAEEPRRPVVLATNDPTKLLLGHTLYDRRDPFRSRIVFGLVGLGDQRIPVPATPVIAPDPVLRSRINDITGPKREFPAYAPWIVLASDA